MPEDESIAKIKPQVDDNLDAAQTIAPAKNSSFNNKKVLIFVAFVASLIILGVGAAAYNQVVLNNPDRIWEQAVQNTTDGFTEASKILAENPVKGGNIAGSINVTEPTTISGTVEGSWYEKNAMFNANIDISGIAVSSELRVVAGANNDDPSTAYLKIDGLESISSLLSLIQPDYAGIVGEINGNWYKIDNTSQTEMIPEVDNLNKLSLNPEELTAISEKLNSLLNERLINVDESKSVIVVDKPLGREDFDYVDTYKYSVKIQKQQFTEFLTEFNNIFKGTQLESVLMNEAPEDKQSDATSQIDDVLNSLNTLDTSTISAEVWIDMDYKYFRNVRVPLVKDDTNTNEYIDIGLDYNGGDSLPFYIGYVQPKANIQLSAAFNKTSRELLLGFNVSNKSDSQNIAANGELKITPSNDPVEVETPTGAINISELLNTIEQSGLLNIENTSNNLDLNTLQFDGIEL